MTRLCVGIGVAMTIAAGCKRGPPDPAELVDAGPPNAEQRAALTKEAFADVKPFDDRAEYLLDDASIVEPCITKALKITGGNLPKPSERSRVVYDAGICLHWAQTDPANFPALEKKIADRYAHPVVTTPSAQMVQIDVAVVQGKLAQKPKAGTVIDSSPYVVGLQWSPPEVIRVLKLGLAKVPGKQVYRADVEIPQVGVTGKKWSYVYDANDDVIRVYEPSGLVYKSAKLGKNFDVVPILDTWKLTQDLNAPKLR